MRRLALAPPVLSAFLLAAGPSPSSQDLVFYNARLALKDDRPKDTLTLWLLRNGLLDRGERASRDGDFRSAVWTALGEMGLCPDGFARDERGGAGLWPLALHNVLVDAARRGPAPKRPPPWGAFDVGRQQRFVSLKDVLAPSELRTVAYARTPCYAIYGALPGSGSTEHLRDRRVLGATLRDLLEESLSTLDRSKVESVAAVEARIFDLDLALAELQARQIRRDALAAERQAKALGVSAAGAKEVRAAAELFPSDSPSASFLRRCLSWTVEEWMSLHRSRRLFLFTQARGHSTHEGRLDRLVLAMIDELAARRSGEELALWIGFLGADTPERRLAVFGGERGQRLLDLDPSSGFRDRAAIALHRGIAFLEAGRTQEAIRSFAFAMGKAEESQESSAILGLGRRWLSYVLSRYETDDGVIATLQALVPRQEYNAVVEELAWRAALRADERSFERVVAGARRGGSFDLKAARLRWLARGKVGSLATELRDGIAGEPSLTLRFLRELIEKIEAEEASVRAAHAATLRSVVRVLDPLLDGDPRKRAQRRNAELLADRAQAILEGLRHLDESVGAKARSLSPARETFAGAVRLAPADPLPWPFVAPEPEAPSPFAPLALDPVEWRTPDGAPVFGWRISDAGHD